jgi:hypothetical protein
MACVAAEYLSREKKRASGVCRRSEGTRYQRVHNGEYPSWQLRIQLMQCIVLHFAAPVKITTTEELGLSGAVRLLPPQSLWI